MTSNVKGTTKGYPLIIEADKIECEESPIDREMIIKLLPKIEYVALVGGAKQVAPLCDPPLPELPEELDTSCEGWEETLDEGILKSLHRILLDVHVMEGNLVCPDTGRKFPIKESIPNMILHEDEI